MSDEDNAYRNDQIRLYAQLLTAIFSIYFATIGIILSSGYTRLRRDIINLLTSEQVGSVYAHVLVFSASFCVAATSLPMVGVEPGHLVFFTATFLTLAASLTLFPLGNRLFHFFDLDPLIKSELLPRIARHIEGAANPRNSTSLANHNSEMAKLSFEQITYIDDRMQEDASEIKWNLPSLTDNYTRMLSYYLAKKHQIDPRSYWFPRRRTHPEWFFVGDAATTLALNTSSQLTPEEKPDLNWLETEITKRLTGHIELAFRQRDYELGLRLLARLSPRVSIYSRGFHFAIGMAEIKEIQGTIEGVVLGESKDIKRAYKNTLIAISDTWAALGSNLCIETLRRIITFESELAKFFARDLWVEKSIRELPAFLQVEAASIVEWVEFERQVEGQRLSQPKYLQQLTVRQLVLAYEGILTTIVDFQQRRVMEFAQALLKAEVPEAATQVLLANLHTCWKMPHWYEELSQLLERYYEYEHYKEEQYALPRIDARGMANSFADTRDKAIEALADPDLAGYIFSYEHDEQVPDHFGQVYYALAEQCVLTLQENRPANLKKIIRTFVALAMIADSKFADPRLRLRDEFRLHLVSTVLQDLASVMGYSILYSEYYENPELKDTAVNEFFDWADRAEDRQGYLTRMLRLTDAKSFSLASSPRDLIRTNWKLAFERMCRADGYEDRLSYSSRKKHPSKIVDEFLGSMSDAFHLFLALEILPRLSVVDFELDAHIRILSDRLVNQNDEIEE